MDIFTIGNIDTPWGDYSDELLAGSSYQEGDLVYIERTGPYVPNIIVSGISNIIITDQFKSIIEQENFSGISFQKVVKKKIVELHWELWDKSKDEPEVYPETGEPEDYVDLGVHSDEISNQIGDLWKINVVESGQTERDIGIFPGTTIWLSENTIGNLDFFMPAGVLWNCVSSKAKEWLELNCDGLLKFKKIGIK